MAPTVAACGRCGAAVRGARTTAATCAPCGLALRAGHCGGCGRALEGELADFFGAKPWHRGCLAALHPELDCSVAGDEDGEPPVEQPAPAQQRAAPLADEAPLGHMHGAPLSSSALQCANAHDALSELDALLAGDGYSKRARRRAAVDALDSPPPPPPPQPPQPPQPRPPVFVSTSLEGLMLRLIAMGLLRERPAALRPLRSGSGGSATSVQQPVVLGRDLVDMCVWTRQCASREEACAVGGALVALGFLTHASGQGGFADTADRDGVFLVTMGADGSTVPVALALEQALLLQGLEQQQQPSLLAPGGGGDASPLGDTPSSAPGTPTLTSRSGSFYGVAPALTTAAGGAAAAAKPAPAGVAARSRTLSSASLLSGIAGLLLSPGGGGGAQAQQPHPSQGGGAVSPGSTQQQQQPQLPLERSTSFLGRLGFGRERENSSGSLGSQQLAPVTREGSDSPLSLSALSSRGGAAAAASASASAAGGGGGGGGGGGAVGGGLQGAQAASDRLSSSLTQSWAPTQAIATDAALGAPLVRRGSNAGGGGGGGGGAVLPTHRRAIMMSGGGGAAGALEAAGASSSSSLLVVVDGASSGAAVAAVALERYRSPSISGGDKQGGVGGGAGVGGGPSARRGSSASMSSVGPPGGGPGGARDDADFVGLVESVVNEVDEEEEDDDD